jgi:hypothetical protein
VIALAQVKNWAISVEAKSDLKEIKFRKGHVPSDNFKYYVSSDGRVYQYSIRGDNFKEMFYHIAHGYRRVRIKDITDSVRRYYRVGRLVAEAFIPNNNNDYDIVNHKDGNKLNDNVNNLEWCNISINTQHAYDNNLVKDRGGWISTPYYKRYVNTEINTEVKKSVSS